MNASSPIVKHLVLIGGGHSHLAVLRNFAMNPMPGLALTLITQDVVTPYSGSLPGYLAGKYSLADMHIDLRPLAQFANARLIQAEVENIDLEARSIKLQSRPDIPFDILSLNIGSKPNGALIEGADKFATAVKPIDSFIRQWENWLPQAIERLKAGNSFDYVVVGGGPASVEIAFATHARIKASLQGDDEAFSRLSVSIVCADSELMALHNSKVRQFANSELSKRGIAVLLDQIVVEFKQDKTVFANGEELKADACIYATGASIPEWPFDCGLDRSEDGFINIRGTLQTTSHDFVFATGDAATVENEPRPKSGVYAVRQGAVLANNLRRFATRKSLRNYFPQRQALALLSMGDGRAIASRGELFFQGRLMWSLKHRIDSRFVRKYSELPEMAIPLELEPGLADKAVETRLRQHAMRCAGCGAKVASDVLHEVLSELDTPNKPEIITTPGGIEDAAQIRLDDGRILLQSIDYLKSFSNDPWLFARIATLHCLSDIHAMGVQPHSALAMLGIPHADKDYNRHQLREIMLACKSVLDSEGCDLIGGHSAESAELQIGFCVNGFAGENTTLNKSGAKTGDVIISSKALGTGTLLAADMRYRASHENMRAAFQSMLLSNKSASEIFLQHQATACTDITGFGLAGHLLEILNASNCCAELSLGNIKPLPGAIDSLKGKIYSSLHQDNKLNAQYFDSSEQLSGSDQFELLFDPQTSGGLLATVPEQSAHECLTALLGAGYQDAAMVGKIDPADDGIQEIRLRD